MSPPYWRWPIWAGNNAPRVFRDVDRTGAGRTLSGATIVLTITWDGGSLTLRSGTDPEVVLFDQDDPLEVGMWAVQFSLEQTRAFPLGTPLSYEMEAWIEGVQRTLLQGEIIVSTRNNVDA